MTLLMLFLDTKNIIHVSVDWLLVDYLYYVRSNGYRQHWIEDRAMRVKIIAHQKQSLVVLRRSHEIVAGFTLLCDLSDLGTAVKELTELKWTINSIEGPSLWDES